MDGQSLRDFLNPDETAFSFLARTYVEPILTGIPVIDKHVVLRPGNVLEISGPSGSSKSEFLTQVRLISFDAIFNKTLLFFPPWTYH